MANDKLITPKLLESYNNHLMELISRKSVFRDDTGIRTALAYCERVLRSDSSARLTYYDDAGNLVSLPRNFDAARNAVFLSAHIDTVDADPAEWVSISNPFEPQETSTHIIGRGANDCKAGVAFMLLLSEFHNLIPTDNVVFLVSYREEGNQAKTSTEIGAKLGSAIPLSNTHNLFLCLENTTRAELKVSMEAYDCEPCNAFIAITDIVPKIRDFLSDQPDWKPISIQPEKLPSDAVISKSRSGVSGHAATIKNQENVLYNAIFEDTDRMLSGGDAVQTSVVDNKIDIYDWPQLLRHRAVLNYRGLTSVRELRERLRDVDYAEYFPFSYAVGSDRRDAIASSLAKKLILNANGRDVEVRFTPNPGRSDASAIWNTTRHQNQLDLLTMGPGTRSHIDNGISRKTHGPDEGFHKASGYLAMQRILELCRSYLTEGE